MKKSTLIPFKLLNTEKEYDQALARLEVLFDAPANSVKGQEAELIALLIEEYEKEHYQIDAPDPIEAIRIRMEERQLKQKDLVKSIGSEGVVSEVLNRKRKLNIKMVRNLSDQLKLNAKVLIKDYQLII